MPAAVSSAGGAGAETQREWVERLAHPDPRIRAEAAEALGQRGDVSAAGPLSRAMGDRDSWVRAQAAQALGRLGDVRMVPLLVRALDDRDAWARARAAEALALLGDPRAVEPLLAAAADPETGHSWIADALGRLGDRRAVEPLIHLLRSTDRTMRFRAALALGRLADARAVFSLSQLLSDLDAQVAQAAAEALMHLARQEPVPELRVALPRLRTLCSIRSGHASEVRELFRRTLSGIEAMTAPGAFRPTSPTGEGHGRPEVTVVGPAADEMPAFPVMEAVPPVATPAPSALSVSAPSVRLWLERVRSRFRPETGWPGPAR